MTLGREPSLVLRLVCAFGVTAPLAWARPVVAAQAPSTDVRAQASERFLRGVALYRTGDVEGAIIEFKRAYDLAPSYQVLFNIGQAAVELKDYVHARKSFEEYLRIGGPKIDVDRQRSVRKALSELEGYIGQLEIKVSVPGASIAIDGVVLGSSPQPPVATNLGRRRVSITMPGYARWERVVDVAGRESAVVDVALQPLAQPAVDREDTPRKRKMSVGFAVAAATTGALLVGTSTMTVLAVRSQRKFDRELGRVPTTAREIDDVGQQTRRYAIAADVGIGLSVAGVVTTVVLGLRDRKRTRSADAQARPNLRVSVAFDSISLTGRF